MYLFILITGILLVPKADPLMCYACMQDAQDCNPIQMQCPAELNQCGAIKQTQFNGSSKVYDFMGKTCLKAEQCIQGSVNFGVVRFVATSKCCDSDLCNTQHAPDPPKTKSNGKKCLGCDAQGNCTVSLNCEGDEDFCFSVSVLQGNKEMLLKGCASRSICTQENTFNQQGYGKMSCCQGDFCNSSGSTSASFLLLVTMLTSLLFLSN